MNNMKPNTHNTPNTVIRLEESIRTISEFMGTHSIIPEEEFRPVYNQFIDEMWKQYRVSEADVLVKVSQYRNREV